MQVVTDALELEALLTADRVRHESLYKMSRARTFRKTLIAQIPNHV